MRFKKFTKFIIFTLLISLFSITVFAEPTLEEQRGEIEENIRELEEEVNTALQNIEDIEVQLINIGSEIINLTFELEESIEDKEKQIELMSLRIRYIYEGGGTRMLDLLLGSDSIGEFLAHAEFIQIINEHDREMVEEYANTVARIENIRSNLEEREEQLIADNEEWKYLSENLSQMIEDYNIDIAEINVQIEERDAALAAAALANQRRPQQNYIPNIDFTDGGNNSSVETILAAAHNAIGVPYVWGGSTMAGFDCSGLAMWAHAQAGITIPRTTGQQFAAGRHIPMGQQLPGDLAYTPGHVGIYIGNGQMIEAQTFGTFVLISPVRVNTFLRFW